MKKLNKPRYYKAEKDYYKFHSTVIFPYENKLELHIIYDHLKKQENGKLILRKNLLMPYPEKYKYYLDCFKEIKEKTWNEKVKSLE